jgi:hypothetical protein
MRPLRTLMLVLLLAPALCLAQKRVPLEITLVGEDLPGLALVAALRDVVREWPGPLVAARSDLSTRESYGMRVTGELARPRIKLQLITAPLEAAGRIAVAVNVIYDSPDMPFGGAFIKGMLESCAHDETQACARRILAKASGSIEWMREHWPSLWKTL